MYAEIVFPLPFRNSFTYIVPPDLQSNAKVGIRAVVPFGKRVLTGFIINTTTENKTGAKLKCITDLLDFTPIFNKNDLKFYNWLSEYYLCSLGEALRLSIPYGLEVESKRKIVADKEYCAELLKKEKDQESVKGKILKLLSENENVNLSHIQKAVKKKNIYSAVKNLENEGALAVLDEILEPKVKIKKVKYVTAAVAAGVIYEYIPQIEKRSSNQVKILLEVLSKKKKSLTLTALIKKLEVNRSTVDSLVKKGLLRYEEREVERKFTEVYREDSKIFELTGTQQNVIDELIKDLNPSQFKVTLLHGVTGSGKTQIYIELIKKVLASGKTALILVPEIALTPQITSRLFNNFGETVTVIHSRMSLGERYDSWRKVLKGKSNVVIGARSALFAPLKNIGLIVVDEEHDSSYKQFESVPKYNARDSAIILGQINNCPVILGSATPSIESMYNAVSGKFKLLELPERIDGAKLPKITLVNIPGQKDRRKTRGLFTEELVIKIREALSKKEGVIILQNRRGFSTQVYCNDCGEIEICDNCSVPSVYHINKNFLQCHYCGSVKSVPKVCRNCGSINIKFFGSGTERVEDELLYYFPDAKVRRVDSDSITAKSPLGSILLEFSSGDVDILVGTQMVSKGLDFPRVTVVGVISAETTLWLPDFRADERTFQLLTQVSGRAGRSRKEGEVIIQTYNEKNFTLQQVIKNDYKGFFDFEIQMRRKLQYPPFSRLCLIESKDQDVDKARDAITDFHTQIKKYKKYLDISPPHPALIAKLKGSFRFHIFIKSSKDKDAGGGILRKAVLESFIEFNKKSRNRDVKLIFDVDPQNIM
jgi:primosomal protein N' (replication factor Y) (superfamily II helicase)